MQIQIGDVVQTTIFARGDYLGRVVRVDSIQEDIELGHEAYNGLVMPKSGKKGKTRLSFKASDIASGS